LLVSSHKLPGNPYNYNKIMDTMLLYNTVIFFPEPLATAAAPELVFCFFLARPLAPPGTGRVYPTEAIRTGTRRTPNCGSSTSSSGPATRENGTCLHRQHPAAEGQVRSANGAPHDGCASAHAWRMNTIVDVDHASAAIVGVCARTALERGTYKNC
jgi:hypothetical protein